MNAAESGGIDDTITKRDTLEDLIDGEDLDLNTLKEMARKVRRTMRKAKHFSRQDRPLKHSRKYALRSLENLSSLASYIHGLDEGNWSDLEESTGSVLQGLNPFLSFYRSHGKLPDLELQEALAYVLYVGVVEGKIDLGDNLEMSRDTPRGRYP